VLAIRDALRPAEATPGLKEAATRAIALDGTLAAAHASLAFARWVYDRDWDAAASGFQRALALDPGDAAAHAWYASYLASRGNLDEAITAIERAQAIDGLSPGIGTDAGELYYRAGQYERAQVTLEAVVGAHADFATARTVLGLVYLRTGRVRDALAQLETAHRLDGGAPTLSTLAYAFGVAAMRIEAERARDGVLRMARDRYVPPFVLAIAHLGAGDPDAALDHLERAVDEQSPSTVLLAVDPRLDRLHGHPRFEALIRRTGIPARAAGSR
jgi:tetratricopeptide (TPR) repeat protein